MNDPDPAELWEEVRGWLRVAQADQRTARLGLTADPPLCGVAAFHCQQAAEKLLKGFLVRGLVDFGKTHDLDRLGRSVLARFPDLVPLVVPLRPWTLWSVAYRYPGEAGAEPEPSIAELSRALELIARLDAALRALAPDAAARPSGRPGAADFLPEGPPEDPPVPPEDALGFD